VSTSRVPIGKPCHPMLEAQRAQARMRRASARARLVEWWRNSRACPAFSSRIVRPRDSRAERSSFNKYSHAPVNSTRGPLVALTCMNAPTARLASPNNPRATSPRPLSARKTVGSRLDCASPIRWNIDENRRPSPALNGLAARYPNLGEWANGMCFPSR